MDAVNLLSGINAATSRMRGNDALAQDAEQTFSTLLSRNEGEHAVSAETDPDAEAGVLLADTDEAEAGSETEPETVIDAALIAPAEAAVPHELMLYAPGAMPQILQPIEAAPPSDALAGDAVIASEKAPNPDFTAVANVVASPAPSIPLSAPYADGPVPSPMSAPLVELPAASASLNESLAMAAPGRVSNTAASVAQDTPALGTAGLSGPQTASQPEATRAGAAPAEPSKAPRAAASVLMLALEQANAVAQEPGTPETGVLRPQADPVTHPLAEPLADPLARGGDSASISVPEIEATQPDPAVPLEKASAMPAAAVPNAAQLSGELARADLQITDLEIALPADEVSGLGSAVTPSAPQRLSAENAQILQGQLGDVMRAAKIIDTPRAPRAAHQDPAKATAEPLAASDVPEAFDAAAPVLSTRSPIARIDPEPQPDMPEPDLAAKAGEPISDRAPAEPAPRVQMSGEGGLVVRSFDQALRAVQSDAVRAPLGGSDALTRTVADSLQSVDMKADGTTVMRLRPHGLGMIEVEIGRHADERARVVLRIQNPMVLEALRADKGAINDLLSQNGLSGASVELGQYQPGAQSGQGGAASMSGQPDARRSAGDGAAQNSGGGAEAAASDDPATEAGSLHPGQSVNILI